MISCFIDNVLKIEQIDHKVDDLKFSTSFAKVWIITISQYELVDIFFILYRVLGSSKSYANQKSWFEDEHSIDAIIKCIVKWGAMRTRQDEGKN